MSFFVDAQQAIRAAISDLEEEGFGTEELREVADALADLIEAAPRVVRMRHATNASSCQPWGC